MVGRGGTKTYLRIDLTKTDGQAGGCGVKYNAVSQSTTIIYRMTRLLCINLPLTWIWNFLPSCLGSR